jgi:hypothetical protein
MVGVVIFNNGVRSTAMGNKTPNGNIIVDATGGYNRYDSDVHKHKFEKIKRDYAIGSQRKSRMLTAQEIARLAPTFTQKLGSIVGIRGSRAIDIISRKGRILTQEQVEQLLAWLNA